MRNAPHENNIHISNVFAPLEPLHLLSAKTELKTWLNSDFKLPWLSVFAKNKRVTLLFFLDLLVNHETDHEWNCVNLNPVGIFNSFPMLVLLFNEKLFWKFSF